MPQLYCQNYLVVLENFNIAKKTIIARAHSIITILKLKLNNKFNLRFYRKIQGYTIILS